MVNGNETENGDRQGHDERTEHPENRIEHLENEILFSGVGVAIYARISDVFRVEYNWKRYEQWNCEQGTVIELQSGPHRCFIGRGPSDGNQSVYTIIYKIVDGHRNHSPKRELALPKVTQYFINYWNAYPFESFIQDDHQVYHDEQVENELIAYDVHGDH